MIAAMQKTAAKKKKKGTVPSHRNVRLKSKGKRGGDGDDEKDKYTTIKMSLRNALRYYDHQYDIIGPAINIDIGNALAFKRELETRVIEMTKCMKLGSLNVHCSLMHEMHNNAAQPNLICRFFDVPLNKHSFNHYFRGVQHLRDPAQRARSGYELYEDLERWAVRHHVAAPQVEGYGNVFSDATSMYYTNFCNNIWMHAKSRMRKFFYMAFWPDQQQRPTKPEVEQTLRYLFYDDVAINAQPSQRMLDAFQDQLLTPNGYGQPRRGYRGYFWNMKTDANWFKFVPIFMRLQELIRQNNLNHMDELRRKVPRRQKKYKRIKNFTVIPITSFKRQHIKIDNESLFHIAKRARVKHASICERGDVNRPIKGKQEYMNRNDYDALWRHLFRIELVDRRDAYTFHNHIQTDGVAISFTCERRERVGGAKDDKDAAAERWEKFLAAVQVYSFDVGERLTLGGIHVSKQPNTDGSVIDRVSKTLVYFLLHFCQFQ